MNQLNSINTISSLLSRFVAQVKGLNAISQYGINQLSETVLIPLFKELFGYQDLENFNNTLGSNYPGIDIGDKKRRVAFQITSTADVEKIKHTLRQFSSNEQYKLFDQLYIYCLTEKAKHKPDRDFNELTKGLFSFSLIDHILDYKDLLKIVNSITDYDQVQRIEQLLTKQFSEIKLETYKEHLESPLYETVYSNLLKIALPEKLYTARIAISRKDLANKKIRIYNDREMIYQYKKENNLRFSADWVDYGKQLFSFHDLSNRQHDISQIIDPGTVETMYPEEFYLENKDQERAFKALLKFCFAKHAHFLDIEHHHLDNLFVFRGKPDGKITRRESWNSGRRSASRDVVKFKLRKNSNDIWYCTHLSFAIGFKYIDEQWYAEISPDWFVSYDGVNRYAKMDKEVVSWLKKKERNMHVFNNTKFIANYLKYGRMQTDLFQDEQVRRPKNFITFLNLEGFKNAPFLSEEDWKTKESEELLTLMTDKEGNVDTEL